MKGRSLLLTAGILGAASVFTAYYVQPILLYHPARYNATTVKKFQSALEQHGFQIDMLQYKLVDGSNQTSFLVSDTRSSGEVSTKLMVFFGGNGMTALDGVAWFVQLNDAMNQKSLSDSVRTIFLAFDYPSYGMSEGSPSPDTIQESVEKAVAEAMKRLKIDSVDIVGHSLGAAVAAKYISSLTHASSGSSVPPSFKISRLVMSAPFTSIADMGSHLLMLPMFAARLITRHQWDNKSELKNIVASGIVKDGISIVHGHEDEIVPFRMGKELKDSYATSFFDVEGAGHNDLLSFVNVYAKIFSSRL